MIEQSLFCQFLELGARTSIITIRIYTYTATWRKDTGHFYILRIHQFNKILHNLIHAVLMKIAMISKAEKIEFQAFALYHPLIRYIINIYGREIGLPRYGAKTGELRTIETNPIIILLMFVGKSL